MYVEIGQVHHVIGSSEASGWKGCSSEVFRCTM